MQQDDKDARVAFGDARIDGEWSLAGLRGYAQMLKLASLPDLEPVAFTLESLVRDAGRELEAAMDTMERAAFGAIVTRPTKA